MITIGKYFILVALAIFSTIPADAQGENPPEPSEVYRTVDALWKEKQFDVIQQYLEELLKKQPNYIPAMIAEIRRLKLDGAQYPEALVMVSKIENAIERDPLSVSPGFYDLFKSYSKRLDDAWLVYRNNGIGKEERKNRFKIESSWRPRLSWKQELLFLSAPYGSIRSEGLQAFNFPDVVTDDLKKLDVKTLQTKTFDLQISDSERQAFAVELARRYTQGDMDDVVEGLSHPTAIIVAPYVVEGFWKIAGDLSDEELLRVFASNPSVFEGVLLWVMAKAPPEHRFRAQKLMDTYAESFFNEGDRAYAKLLKEAMKRQSRADKYGKPNSFDNRGRPLPKGTKPFGRKTNGESIESETTSTWSGILIMIGILIFVLLMMIVKFKR